DVIRDALADAGVDASKISLIEAHGTGTKLGDPIEVEALQAVYGRTRPASRQCVLGSVKTNLGHLEAAAGVAGLIKAALCLEREAIPPHLHFKTWNPHISLDQSPFVICTELRPFPRGGEPRVACVSSFGIGGTNAHVIVQEAPMSVPEESRDIPIHDHVLALSARTEEALLELLDRYARFLDSTSADLLAAVCAPANAGRTHFAHRAAICARSMEELRERLAHVAQRREGLHRAGVRPSVAFFFPGGDGEHIAMGRPLYDVQPAFREAMGRCGA